MATILTHSSSDTMGETPAKLNTNFAALNTDSHAHNNKATLDKISESGANPTWNGAPWPGAAGGSSDASSLTTGTLPSGRLPALTGDVALAAGTNTTALATVNSNVGVFGSATSAPTFTVNAKGLLTAAVSVTITPAFSSITGRPTTLAGYGITDGIPAFSAITAKPTTLSGYGITDGIPSFSAVTAKPTTVSGYGITDAATTTQTINAQIGTTYAPVLADASNTLVTLSNAAAIAVTIPTNATVAYPVGTILNFLAIGAGQVTFAAAGGATLNSEGSAFKSKAQWATVGAMQIAANSWVLCGNTST